MRLNAKILKNVAGVNNWSYANQASVQEGQANEIYFQIVDYDQIPGTDKSIALPDAPLRYIPQGTEIGLSASFPSIDSAQEFTIIGIQPFADDKSIWKVTLLSSQVPKSGNFKIRLIEDGNAKNILAKNAITVDLLNVGGC
jgi:hypothetical protein